MSGGIHLEKATAYHALCNDVAAYYQQTQIYHCGKKIISLGWCSDCQEINLWAYWQGRDHFNPKILLVGQDWGAPSDDPAIMDKIRQMNNGTHILYMDHHATSPTDKNLVKLFRQIGYSIDTDDQHNQDLFFTNLILGYRDHGTSGSYQAKWLGPNDQSFFCRLVDILQPKVILCLGRSTFEGVMKSLKIDYQKYKSFNARITAGAVQSQYGSLSLTIFPLSHCGSMGTMNRNRYCKDPQHSSDPLWLQKKDWALIKDAL